MTLPKKNRSTPCFFSRRLRSVQSEEPCARRLVAAPSSVGPSFNPIPSLADPPFETSTV
jgi:hypothetical protein